MPFQEILLALIVLAVAAGWLKGGRPEREAVVVLIAGSFVSNLLFYVRVGNFALGDWLGDLVLFVGLGWLALKRDRWWIMAAFGVLVLVMLVHLMVLLTPTISIRTDISARWGLLALLLVLYAVGPIERRLAGEAPVSPTRLWRRSGRDGPAPLDESGRTA